MSASNAGPARRWKALACVALAAALLAPIAMPTAVRAVPATAQIYAVGDSITAGAQLMFGWQAWPERAASRALGPDHTRMHVVAHSGQCLVATICGYGPPLVTTWAAEVLAAHPTPTTVLVLIGRNDLAHVSDEQLLSALHRLVDAAAAVGIRVIVGTILPSSTAYRWAAWTEPQRRSVNVRIRAEFGDDVFDCAASIGDALNGPVYDSGDGIHPAWPGHVVIADAIPLGRIQ